jgi:hypothetical protein
MNLVKPLLLLSTLIVAILFTGCNNNSSEEISYQNRVALDKELKSGNVNKISFKLETITASDNVLVKLPFQIINPVVINFYDENRVQINSNTISFSEDNWNEYSKVIFDREIDVANIYYQIEDMENQGDTSSFIRLVSDEFIGENQKEVKSESPILSEEQYAELLEMGYSSEEIDEALSSPAIDGNEYVLNISPVLNETQVGSREIKSNSCTSTVWTSYGYNVSWDWKILWLQYTMKAYTNFKDNCNNPLKADVIKTGILIGENSRDVIDDKVKSGTNVSKVKIDKKDTVIDTNGVPKIKYIESTHYIKYGKWLDKTYRLYD